jgi:hypothetical protein
MKIKKPTNVTKEDDKVSSEKIEAEENELLLTESEARILRMLGLKWIEEDTEALIDYAINKILFDVMKQTQSKNELLTKLINKNKV